MTKNGRLDVGGNKLEHLLCISVWRFLRIKKQKYRMTQTEHVPTDPPQNAIFYY